MNILQGIDGLKSLPPGSVLSVGNYDGVHRGHAAILGRCDALRRRDSAAGVAVVTFEPHPMTVLRPDKAPPRLTTPAQKRERLASLGADWLVELAPEPAVLDLAAEQFWQVLRDDVRPAHLVEGQSFYFGKGRGGSVQKLREWSAGTGVRLHVVEPVSVALLDLSVVAVSSSLIRWLLAHGRARDAAVCLGRAFALEGGVVKGFQRGRTIGVPTANLDCGGQMIPADGVYAARCDIDGVLHPAALSVGTMPTFEGKNPCQVEAHLLDFTGDLYGRTIRVEILDWLRDQWKYGSLDALKAQIARDLAAVRQRADADPARPIAAALV